MMKSDKPTVEGRAHPPKPAPALRSRSPRHAPTRPPLLRLGPPLASAVLDTPLKHWFEEEVEALQRLAHTQRLKGDYVAAQILEKEIRILAADVNALLHTREGTR